MKSHRHSDREEQLSLYIDGMLEDAERIALERELAQDESLRSFLAELRATSELLRHTAPLDANPFLAEKTLNEIRRMEEAETLPLSIPRRYLPVFSGVIALLIITAGVITWWQGGGSILRFFEDKSSEVARVYEEDILKGWIMPLFQRTDDDQVLEFAMFGTLPLDAAESTTLRIDPATSDGFRVELAGSRTPVTKSATLEDLYSRIRPNERQRRTLDTIFAEASRRIESSVLLDQRKRLAIDPALHSFQRVLLSSIATQLDQRQHELFRDFLAEYNTTYELTEHAAKYSDANSPAAMRARAPIAGHPTDFVVLSPDSVRLATLNLNMDSLRRLMLVIESKLPELEEPIRQLARVVSERASDLAVAQEVRSRRVRIAIPDAPGVPGALSVTIDAEPNTDFRWVDKEIASAARNMIIVRRALPPPPPREARGGLRETEKRVRLRVEHDRAERAALRADSALRHFMIELERLHEQGEDSLGRPGRNIELRRLIGPDGGIRLNLDSLLRNSIPPNPEIQDMIRKELREELRLTAPEQLHTPTPPRPPRVRVIQDTSVDI
ncbi:MAG: hypothetical protein M5R41_02625 [Bacteroidia bacterium]|nr:hypothetical protein [Bacteroidia bacterium]